MGFVVYGPITSKNLHYGQFFLMLCMFNMTHETNAKNIAFTLG